MEINKKQFEKNKKWLQVEDITPKLGNRYTIYIKFIRWAKNITIQQIFKEPQKRNIIYVQGKILCPDSTGIK